MTPNQRKVLDAIRDLTINGVCPSYDEIREHCGLCSKSEVFRMVSALERDGWITRKGDKARAIMLTTPEPLDHMSPAALIALRGEIDRRLAS